MNETTRDDAQRSPMASGAQGSGSDTVSAANISAGTSVGNVGQPARPQEYRGGSGSAAQGAGQSDWSQGSSTGRGTTGTAQGAGGTARMADDLRERAGDALGEASEWARDQYERGSRQLNQAREQSLQQFRQARSGIERFVSENPLMVGVVGLAAGLVIGALLPRTRQEDRAFGRWADEVRDQGMRYVREATQRGREYVEETFGNDSEGEWRPDEGRDERIRSAGPRYQNH